MCKLYQTSPQYRSLLVILVMNPFDKITMKDRNIVHTIT